MGLKGGVVFLLMENVSIDFVAKVLCCFLNRIPLYILLMSRINDVEIATGLKTNHSELWTLQVVYYLKIAPNQFAVSRQKLHVT